MRSAEAAAAARTMVAFSLVSTVPLASFFLILRCFRISATASTVSDDEILIMVQILYRHGDRSPADTFPTNPLPESAWPQGFSQLTQRGLDQHYSLGQFFRSRYIEGNPYRLLSESYNRHEIEIRSTDLDRTLMSAYANRDGLYPPSDQEIWNMNLSWQPIPVHTVPVEVDYILPMTCPKYSAQSQTFVNSDDIQKEEENQEFYKMLANKTGNKIESLKTIYKVYDPIFCARNHGLKEPDWSNMTWENTTIFNKLKELDSHAYDVKYNRGGETRLLGGPLLGEMIQHMQSKISNTTQFKSFMYSAHDSTVSAFLSAMKVFNRVAPPYTAAVLVELVRIDKDHVVRVFYRNDSTHDPYPLIIPGCSVDCPFDQFHQLVKENIPDDWKAECQTNLKSDYSWFPMFMGVVIIFVSVSVLLKCVVVLWRRRKYSAYENLEKDNEKQAYDVMERRSISRNILTRNSFPINLFPGRPHDTSDGLSWKT